jgi:BirA family transcriptional regulator, biotin operon repressor / biotin---[acetyl-CoA-carboxylase] ligase
LILRPDASRLTYLPFLAGLSMAHSIRNQGLVIDLKWPNDIVVSNKKLCGILLQSANDEKHLLYAILGCGINVNSVFPPELQETATSIAIERGVSVAREPILADFLLEFERRYERIDRMPWSVLCEEIESQSSYVRGCEVEVHESGGIVRGVTAGLDGFGGLILRTEQGPRVFYAGEIQSCRKK